MTFISMLGDNYNEFNERKIIHLINITMTMESSSQNVFLQPYEFDPQIDYAGKLWEPGQIVENRAAQIKLFGFIFDHHNHYLSFLFPR